MFLCLELLLGSLSLKLSKSTPYRLTKQVYCHFRLNHYGSWEIIAERLEIESLQVSSNSFQLPSCHKGMVCEAQI